MPSGWDLRGQRISSWRRLSGGDGGEIARRHVATSARDQRRADVPACYVFVRSGTISPATTTASVTTAPPPARVSGTPTCSETNANKKALNGDVHTFPTQHYPMQHCRGW